MPCAQDSVDTIGGIILGVSRRAAFSCPCLAMTETLPRNVTPTPEEYEQPFFARLDTWRRL
jgi:hypothetical protein